MTLRRWGFYLGRLSVCWWDMWDRRLLLEVAWGAPSGTGRVLLGIGLHRMSREDIALIAAAPDLYEALMATTAHGISACKDENCATFVSARAALARVTDRTSAKQGAK